MSSTAPPPGAAQLPPPSPASSPQGNPPQVGGCPQLCSSSHQGTDISSGDGSTEPQPAAPAVLIAYLQGKELL